MTPNTVLTIGHSTHSASTFLSLLQRHGVTTVADVRSTPLSRFTPQFNLGALRSSLRDVDIKYVFLGEELGARTKDIACYVDGRVQYDRLARTSAFTRGIGRLLKGTRTERIAIMCAEQEPLDCHRTVLIAQVLTERGITIHHVHGDGGIESHTMALRRLMAKFGLNEDDLLYTPTQRLQEALSRQEYRIAYVNEELRVSEASGR